MPVTATYICDKTGASGAPPEGELPTVLPVGWIRLLVQGDGSMFENAALVLSPEGRAEFETWLGKAIFPPPPPQTQQTDNRDGIGVVPIEEPHR